MLEASTLFGHSGLKSLAFLSPFRALPLCRQILPPDGNLHRDRVMVFFKNPPLLPNLVPRRQLCASESPRDFALIHRQLRQLELLTPSAARAKAIWKSYQPRYLRLWLRPHWLQWWWWPAGQSLTNSSWQRPKLCPKCGSFISLHLNKSTEVCLKLPVGGGGMCRRWPL